MTGSDKSEAMEDEWDSVWKEYLENHEGRLLLASICIGVAGCNRAEMCSQFKSKIKIVSLPQVGKHSCNE